MRQPSQPVDIAENRPLTETEQSLVEWLLEHGNEEARKLQPSVRYARVVRKCACGCASVDFSINGTEKPRDFGMSIVSDYGWRTENRNLCGCFLFSVGGQLAGLEIWSIDGVETSATLPSVADLTPLDEINANAL